jgi:pimeloyl-ACP methyl ester carboxylesterase
VTDRVDYDEFGLFHENAAEYGLPWAGPPVVRRVFAEVAAGRRLSALAWKDSDPELVFLHGGAQNAHTWDTVAMALDRPLVAIDLPGHGHSDGPGDRPEGQLSAEGNAVDVAAAIRQLAPRARAVVGMSLGGLTTIALTAEAPELVRKVLHNAEQQADGTWVWRWARHRPPAAPAGPARPEAAAVRYDQLWAAVSSITVPLLLARGMRPDSVLGDEQEEELRRRLPSAQVVHVAEAGHSLQGDTPLELAALIQRFVFDP